MCTEFLHAHARVLQAFLPKADDVARAVGGSRSRRALAISSAVSASSASASASASATTASTADKAAAGGGDNLGASAPATSSSPALDLSPPPPPTPSEYTLKRLRQWLLVDRFLQALVGHDRDSLDVLLAVLDPLVKFILRDYKFKVCSTFFANLILDASIEPIIELAFGKWDAYRQNWHLVLPGISE